MVESKGSSPEEGEQKTKKGAEADPPPPTPPHGPTTDKPTGKYLAALSLAALGIVYGDIGTSPLYAFKECFHGVHAVPASPSNILGVLSLIFWALVIVICIKYLGFILRADNRGEGGIIALMSLVVPSARTQGKKRTGLLLVIGLFGAALLYGDGMITPAISVLSAVEGLEIAAPAVHDFIIPITIAILMALFFFQKRGTAGIGKVFGPVTLIWFTTLSLLGIYQLVQTPSVLRSINPQWAFSFFVENELRGFLVVGSVFLVVTGAEALYADIGHFGIRPIGLTWFGLVFPALLLNYFGQGALLLREPEAAVNPFYNMGPTWAQIPMIVIATAATVIASQAVISGAFSLTRQAVQLGYLPRLQVEHTSASRIGQIYVPAVNWGLAIACIGLVIGFGSSSRLAAAYGVAVTTDMVFTTILFAVFLRKKWRWGLPLVILTTVGFLIVDLSFWGANIVKVPDGGWFPLVVAGLVFIVMTTWYAGRRILNVRLSEGRLSNELFVSSVEKHPPIRVPGTAVFMDRTHDVTPHALLHNIKHNKVLHNQVLLLTIITEETPHVDADKRLQVTPLGHGLYRIVARFGFMEDPNVPEILQMIDHPALAGVDLNPTQVSYFLGRETLIPAKKANLKGMAVWRENLFAWMSKNSTPATRYFRIPPNRVVEMGAQIEL